MPGLSQTILFFKAELPQLSIMDPRVATVVNSKLSNSMIKNYGILPLTRIPLVSQIVQTCDLVDLQGTDQTATVELISLEM